jgi:hypothetical protein
MKRAVYSGWNPYVSRYATPDWQILLWMAAGACLAAVLIPPASVYRAVRWLRGR